LDSQAPISATVAASNSRRAASLSAHSSTVLGVSEQLGVVVGQPGEEHHSAPAFFAPQVGFEAERFGP
jgi:hypothetical protein